MLHKRAFFGVIFDRNFSPFTSPSSDGTPIAAFAAGAGGAGVGLLFCVGSNIFRFVFVYVIVFAMFDRDRDLLCDLP